MIKHFFCLYILCLSLTSVNAQRIEIRVKNVTAGAPVTIGIPFARDALSSPDHTRLVDTDGQELPSQTTQVTNWEPLSYSVKWLWVFFFATDDEVYYLEYGDGVSKSPISGSKIRVKNAQRTGQTTFVDTGTLRLSICKGEGGFVDNVLLDVDGDGYDENDTIALCREARGSFLDILDEAGIDRSSARIHRTVREKGSGPLHAILRLEGNYTYEREDNRTSPFIIRLHFYAGKSYVRIFHTLTYTGTPDQHTPMPGEHESIALDAIGPIKNDSATEDKGWMEPRDQIAGTGLTLNFNLKGKLKYRTSYHEGKWAAPGEVQLYQNESNLKGDLCVYQTGPKPDRIPPVPNSTPESRIDGFEATISIDGETQKQNERASGWADLTGELKGIAIGIRHFLEEYPKEIEFDLDNTEATAHIWSARAGPMSFARGSLKRDQGMIANFAEGVTKTSELVYFFHRSDVSVEEIENTMNYFLKPPVPHASASTYSDCGVYGRFSPRSEDHLVFERAIDYKFDWQLFNQHWEPWYGMFDYGDQKNIFYKEDWHRWQNNEPAIDFMYWLQFMRTGDPKYYHAAEAMSRHTMDVDNVHWPTDPPYYGDTNPSLDYWKWKTAKSVATPYLGVGRRHANQHWSALLSAHVWLQGWLASYYLTGYHRGLDIARLTADSYTRRIWGEHGLTGRRLYLSIWNMVEAWDATKDLNYFEDLKDRVYRAISLQEGTSQYDNLLIDRYGYAQVYMSHGLYKYYQLTRDEKVRDALIRHARAVRDNPPLNHDYESYFSTIHSLLVGYEFTGNEQFFTEALERSEKLKLEALPLSFDELGNQKEIVEALGNISQLPTTGDFTRPRRSMVVWDIHQGLRTFGWTHMYNVPWLLYWIRENE